MDMNKTAVTVASVGAVNWGLVEFLDFNLVSKIPIIPASIIYGAVAISGAYLIYKYWVK